MKDDNVEPYLFDPGLVFLLNDFHTTKNGF